MTFKEVKKEFIDKEEKSFKLGASSLLMKVVLLGLFSLNLLFKPGFGLENEIEIKTILHVAIYLFFIYYLVKMIVEIRKK